MLNSTSCSPDGSNIKPHTRQTTIALLWRWRAITRRAILTYGWEVVGSEDAFNGILEQPRRLMPLDLATVVPSSLEFLYDDLHLNVAGARLVASRVVHELMSRRFAKSQSRSDQAN